MNTLASVIKYFTAETHFIKTFALDNKPSVIIQNESASNPYSKYMLISDISVDVDAQLLETPRKIITESMHQGTRFCWVVMMLSCLRLP